MYLALRTPSPAVVDARTRRLLQTHGTRALQVAALTQQLAEQKAAEAKVAAERDAAAAEAAEAKASVQALAREQEKLTAARDAAEASRAQTYSVATWLPALKGCFGCVR